MPETMNLALVIRVILEDLALEMLFAIK